MIENRKTHSRHFTKENTQMANKHIINVFHIINHEGNISWNANEIHPLQWLKLKDWKY